MKTAIVTGAGGFLGRNLIPFLLKKGVAVFALDLPVRENAVLQHERVHFIAFEDGSFEKAAEVCHNVDVLYHLAWAGVSTSEKNTPQIQVSNISHTINAITFAKNTGVRKIICPGSTSEHAYCNEPINGHNMPSPGDLYAATKIAVRYIAQTLAKQLEVDLCWLLVASIYGPGRNDNNVITYCIQSLLRGERPLLTSLEQNWDYLYIDDLIEALYLAGESGHGGATYAVGSGTSRALFRYIEDLRDAIDPALPLGIGEVPYKMGKPDSSQTDISLLKADTGFLPKVSFECGIKKTIDYYKQLQM